MPARLPITPRDKRDLLRRYTRGETPLDIANSRRELGLSARQIANLISREGWSKLRTEAAETKRRAASEALAQLRQDSVDDFEQIVQSVKRGLKNDAEQLEDGWQFVQDAADVSALQRAKGLHLGRTLKLFGLDGKPEPANSRAAALAVVFVEAPEANAPQPLNVTSTAAVEDTEASETFNLDFAEDDSG